MEESVIWVNSIIDKKDSEKNYQVLKQTCISQCLIKNHACV